MRRGDVVAVAVSGDYGKPRPAVIVQSDAFPDQHLNDAALVFKTGVVGSNGEAHQVDGFPGVVALVRVELPRKLPAKPPQPDDQR